MSDDQRDLAAVAAELRRLVESSPATEDAVEAWSAHACEVMRQVGTRYPNLTLPVEVLHFIHDADVRVRDPEHAASQNQVMEGFIRDLESGVLPRGNMAVLSIDLPGRTLTLSSSPLLLVSLGLLLFTVAALLIARGCR